MSVAAWAMAVAASTQRARSTAAPDDPAVVVAVDLAVVAVEAASSSSSPPQPTSATAATRSTPMTA